MAKEIWLITEKDNDGIIAATTFEKAVAALVHLGYITARTYAWKDYMNDHLSRVGLIFGDEWREKVLALTLNDFLEMFEGIFSVQLVPLRD